MADRRARLGTGILSSRNAKQISSAPFDVASVALMQTVFSEFCVCIPPHFGRNTPTVNQLLPVNIPQNQIMLKKLLTQFVAVSAIAACAIFATGCGDEVAEDANDDEGEGEGEFEMGDEPTGGEEK